MLCKKQKILTRPAERNNIPTHVDRQGITFEQKTIFARTAVLMVVLQDAPRPKSQALRMYNKARVRE